VAAFKGTVILPHVNNRYVNKRNNDTWQSFMFVNVTFEYLFYYRFKALTSVIKRSEASTMMELEVQLKAAADSLKNCNKDVAGLNLNGKTSISLTAGCELFLRYVTRCFLDFPVSS
jgi:hypothetical protein